MKLSVRHFFACSPEHFWKIFWDPAFDAYVQAASPVQRELLESKEENGVRIERFRLTGDKPLPGPVAVIAGTDRLSYEQTNRFDPHQQTLSWEVVPSVLPKKITAKGRFTVVPAKGGCERVVDGDIEVRILLVGSKVEQGIVDTVKKSYEDAAKLTNEWLRQHPPA